MNQHSFKLWFGIIFILMGALLITENFGLFNFGFVHLIFSWHTILIIIGILLLTRSKSTIAGVILIVIGLYGILNHIPFFNFSSQDILPLIIIIVGLYIILKRNESKNKINDKRIHIENKMDYKESTTDLINEMCVLTHYKRKISSDNFKGGTLTIIAGYLNLDLSNSILSNSENILDLTCLAGGFSIILPKNLKVFSNVTTIFGGFDTKQYITNKTENEAKLIIRGTILFGGGEIKSTL